MNIRDNISNSIIGVILSVSLAACGKQAIVNAPATESVATDTLELKPAAISAANIKVETITARTLARTIAAPGEVKSNEYRSAQITTRVSAQVVRRLAKLGDAVKQGQPLVTLTSVEVAAAQGEAVLKAREWDRVRELGEAIVGGRRYLEARIAAEQARAKLIAYGLTPAEADNSQTLGQFTLVAPRSGTVLRDEFMEGERIEPGHALFLIADESAAWVEANLSPTDASKVVEGSDARVKVDGRWLDGKVIQKHHLIEETTRTIPVRIEVQVTGDHLHNGEFVECRVAVGSLENAIAVPNAALYQGTDNTWAVFVQEAATKYKRVPVQIKEELGELTVVEGLTSGAQVVTQGAFYLNSELAKASFAEAE